MDFVHVTACAVKSAPRPKLSIRRSGLATVTTLAPPRSRRQQGVKPARGQARNTETAATTAKVRLEMGQQSVCQQGSGSRKPKTAVRAHR